MSVQKLMILLLGAMVSVSIAAFAADPATRTGDLSSQGAYPSPARPFVPEKNETQETNREPVNAEPTLMLTGALEGIPVPIVSCKPFTIRYTIRNAGTLTPPPGCAMRFEIASSQPGQSLYTNTFPLVLGSKTVTVDKVDLPPGDYTVRLTAIIPNEQNLPPKELKLVEKAATVSSPVVVTRMNATYPRVLVWLGRDGRIVEQAVSGALIKQAFEQQDLYYKVVDSEENFVAQAMTGLFTVYLLIEPQDMPAKTDWLKNKIDQGHGMVLIGSGEVARSVAERFGFAFEEKTSRNEQAIVSFAENTGFPLSGTMPVSGKYLHPRKKGAKSIALFSRSNQTAVLADESGKGKIVVMPLALSRSAFNSGATALYSLVVRMSVLFTAPESEIGDGPLGNELSIFSLVNGVKARIREVLPAGSQALWTSEEDKVDGNIITYDFIAGKEPHKLLYLYLPSFFEKNAPLTEIEYQCADTFAGRGKIQ